MSWVMIIVVLLTLAMNGLLMVSPWGGSIRNLLAIVVLVGASLVVLRRSAGPASKSAR